MSAADHLREAIDFGCTRDDHDHVAMHRAEVLTEAADKLALELAPETQGAGPGFLLALRLAMRALRRMADEAATGNAQQLARLEDARHTLQQNRQGGAL